MRSAVSVNGFKAPPTNYKTVSINCLISRGWKRDRPNLPAGEFSLAEILRESAAAVARGAQKKRVILNCEVDDDLPSLTSDRGRLRQVIYNVLAYAIARSPEQDTVDLSAEINAEIVEIIIMDNGEALTKPHEIGMLDADDDKAGTGELGLAIARQNIQMLGGTISAANGDVGLELRISLPRNPPRENHQ